MEEHENFEKLKAAAFAQFVEFKAKLTQEHPSFVVSWNFEEIRFSLSLLKMNAPVGEPDLVDFEVALLYFHNVPIILADVVWGDGDGRMEMDFETQDRSTTSFENAENRIPVFLDALREAAIHGPRQVGLAPSGVGRIYTEKPTLKM